MIMAGSQIIQFQPGEQVKLHTLGFNYMDELPRNKLSASKALLYISNIQTLQKWPKSDLGDSVNTLNQFQFQFGCLPYVVMKSNIYINDT